MKSATLNMLLMFAALGSTAAFAADATGKDRMMSMSPKEMRLMKKCAHMAHDKAMKNAACAANMKNHGAMMNHDAMGNGAMENDAMGNDAMHDGAMKH